MLDASIFREIFNDIPPSGFTAGSEIGPRVRGGERIWENGNVALLGFIFVFALRIVPNPAKSELWGISDTSCSSNAKAERFLATRVLNL